MRAEVVGFPLNGALASIAGTAERHIFLVAPPADPGSVSLAGPCVSIMYGDARGGLHEPLFKESSYWASSCAFAPSNAEGRPRVVSGASGDHSAECLGRSAVDLESIWGQHGRCTQHAQHRAHARGRGRAERGRELGHDAEAREGSTRKAQTSAVAGNFCGMDDIRAPAAHPEIGWARLDFVGADVRGEVGSQGLELVGLGPSTPASSRTLGSVALMDSRRDPIPHPPMKPSTLYTHTHTLRVASASP